MYELTRNNAALVLDLLNARCELERTGVQLYDAVIAKIERSGNARYQAIVDQLRHNRDEEKEHEEWLEAQIRALGGDPHARTSLVELELEEASGIKKVILDGHSQILHLLHALLGAELTDNAGWDLLVKLAGEAGDRAAQMQFAKRLAQEVQHLAFLREAVHVAAEIEILGEEKELPRSLPRALASKGVVAMAAAALAGVVAAGWGAIRLGRAGLSRLREA